MSVENRAFFIAAGESLAQCIARRDDINACLQRARAWAKELGVDQFLFSVRYGFEGMKFPAGTAPKGWARHRRERTVFVPSDARMKEAKAVRARAKECQPTVCYPGESHVSGMEIYYPAIWHTHDGKWIISQHRDVKTAPPGATPIKRSEYMALVEADEEAKAKKKEGAAA